MSLTIEHHKERYMALVGIYTCSVTQIRGYENKPTKSKSVQYTPDEIVMPKNYKKYQKDRGEPITDSKVWSGLFGGKSEE